MARRRQNTGDGGLSLVFVLLVTALGVIAAILVFLFKLAVTVTFYALPVVAGGVLLTLREVGRSPPALPDPRDFDDAAASHDVGKLLGQQAYWLAHHAQQYERGASGGLYRTGGSGERRFDMRSRLGRELNAHLETAEAAVMRIEEDIRSTRLRVAEMIPAWRGGFDAWLQHCTIKLSAIHALLAFGVATTALYVWSLARSEEAYAAHSMLLWNPFPSRLLVSPLIGAALIAYAAFAVMLRFNRRRLIGAIDVGRVEAWHHVEAKWSVETDAVDYFAIEQADIPHEEARSERGQESRQAPPVSPEPPWYEVLGVAPSASEAEIKAAYHAAIKGYHSDRVASLGPKLRALAEEESKRINAAYGEARKARHFR